MADIGKAIAAYEKVTARPRLVVITQGHLPTLLFRHGGVEEVPIKPIDPADIKDTNGAGDAFGTFALLLFGRLASSNVNMTSGRLLGRYGQRIRCDGLSAASK